MGTERRGSAGEQGTDVARETWIMRRLSRYGAKMGNTRRLIT
jgi:hypothetical protein